LRFWREFHNPASSRNRKVPDDTHVLNRGAELNLEQGTSRKTPVLVLKQAQLKRILAMDEFAAQPSISGASNHCHFILQTLRRQTGPNGSV
jgi:hypothetical protein